MPPLTNWLRYMFTRRDYCIDYFEKAFDGGRLKSLPKILWLNQLAMKFLFDGKITFLHQNKEEEKAPPTGIKDGTFLVRKIPIADSANTYVGDMVVLKDPMNKQKFLVRRLAAIEGDEMISTDEKDESFVLGEDECWVLADDEATKPKGTYDSRTFGPVDMDHIVGRAIYVLRNDGKHGPVNNSYLGMIEDKPVLEVELDIEEMKNHNNNDRE